MGKIAQAQQIFRSTRKKPKDCAKGSARRRNRYMTTTGSRTQLSSITSELKQLQGNRHYIKSLVRSSETARRDLSKGK